jgi:Flp pilus assembly protein TadD
VRHYPFVNYDDQEYIYQNPEVTNGLTWHGLKWAFTTGMSANWHPVTWLSHMLDVQLFVANAGAHHLTNVVFHLASTVLLFWLLLQTTGKPGPSSFVAALFAVHPLHVESVAWLSERKDVLSTFFALLTIWAYVRYVRRPRRARYFTVLGFFALGLMSKPMLVTLPFVLFLLDFWPLRRFTRRDLSKVGALIREKIPLVILAGISSLITFFVQKAGGAVAGLEIVPITARTANAFIAYFSYLSRMLWPAKLVALYPVQATVQDWWWAAALALLGISVVAVWMADRRPYIPVGWFWYLGTLVPVIGLVQVGRQATADRYTYVPLIGLFLIVAFGAGEALAGLRWPSYLLPIAASLAIAACIWESRIQLRYWSSSPALWEHALTVPEENPIAHLGLALALSTQGKFDEAGTHLAETVRIEPGQRFTKLYSDAQYNLGIGLLNGGKTDKLDEVATHFTEALVAKPDLAEAHNGLGIVYMTQGKMDSARTELSEAIRLKPDYAGAHNNLGTVLGNQGLVDDAISEYGKAVRLDSSLTDAHINLGILMAKKGKTSDAVKQFSEVLRIQPDNPVARGWLANLINNRSAIE